MCTLLSADQVNWDSCLPELQLLADQVSPKHATGAEDTVANTQLQLRLDVSVVSHSAPYIAPSCLHSGIRHGEVSQEWGFTQHSGSSVETPIARKLCEVII